MPLRGRQSPQGCVGARLPGRVSPPPLYTEPHGSWVPPRVPSLPTQSLAEPTPTMNTFLEEGLQAWCQVGKGRFPKCILLGRNLEHPWVRISALQWASSLFLDKPNQP